MLIKHGLRLKHLFLISIMIFANGEMFHLG